MFESLAIRVAASVAVAAVVSASVVTGLVPAPEALRPTPPEPPRPHVAPHRDAPEEADGGAPSGDRAARGDGSVGLGLGDDGAWLHMEGRDETGGTGSAGVSMTDDGVRLELDSAGPDGTGSAGVSMTDDGVQLWFDVEQSP